MKAFFEVLFGDVPGRRYTLDKAEVTIGRRDNHAPAPDIEINDHAVSRKHARLVREGEDYWLEDCRSRNGTWVNKERITRARLGDSDEVRIGAAVLIYRSLPSGPWIEQEDYCSEVRESMELSDSTKAPHRINAEEKLRAVLHLSQALAMKLDLQQVLEHAVDAMLEVFPRADRALVLLREGDDLVPKAGRARRACEEGIRYSRTVVRMAVEQHRALLCEDSGSGLRLPSAESIANLRLRSLMCAPLRSHRPESLGAIQVDSFHARRAFTAGDMEVLTAVAGQVAVATENAWLHQELRRQARWEGELELAKSVQRNLLPHAPPKVHGYEFLPYYQPAYKVGGDYYDFVRLPDGSYAALLADVAGKGVPAALLMARASSVCRHALLAHGASLTEALAAMNEELVGLDPDGGFVTLALFAVDPRTHELQAACAGHMSPLVRRRNGAVEEPVDDQVRGLALGIERGQSYGVVRTTLDPGDCVLIYSDGLSDALNSRCEFYTLERIRQRLSELTEASPAQTVEALVKDVGMHRAQCDPADDMTLVVAGRVCGEASAS
jgi:serine phosphatase RsbU (regulator of sigma subunit)